MMDAFCFMPRARSAQNDDDEGNAPLRAVFVANNHFSLGCCKTEWQRRPIFNHRTDCSDPLDLSFHRQTHWERMFWMPSSFIKICFSNGRRVRSGLSWFSSAHAMGPYVGSGCKIHTCYVPQKEPGASVITSPFSKLSYGWLKAHFVAKRMIYLAKIE